MNGETKKSLKNLAYSAVIGLACFTPRATLANMPWSPHMRGAPDPAGLEMPSVEINVEIKRGDKMPHAFYSGEFTFEHIPPSLKKMMVLVQPDANNIGIWMNDSQLEWQLSDELFPTSLPEIPEMPLIEWYGPFPESGGIVKVDYDHDLIERQGEFIYFYPFNLYSGTRDSIMNASATIQLPTRFEVAGVWLDNVPYEYSVTNHKLQITTQAEYGSNVTKELLVSLVPRVHVTSDGNDTTGDGSMENPFRTIQKGIDMVEDGDTVLVYPGLYQEEINFLGKAITVQSAEDAAVIEAPDDFAVWFYHGEGSGSTLKNFVIRNSLGGIFIVRSSPTISNVTVVNNDYGIEAYADSDPNISNSIIWNNTYSDLYGCQARYSCIEIGGGGEGNLNVNPQFADSNNGDYHLCSPHGRYWAKHNVWVLDDVTSPCIDGGDPNSDYSNERKPNGGRINMGAYGGTSYASKKGMRWNPSDINHDGWINFIDFAKLAENWLIYQPGTSNIPPEVYIINQQDGIEYPGTIEIEAYASDVDGLVKKVEFFVNKSKIGEDNDGTDGWKTYWQTSPGHYSLITKAIDDDGATTTSQKIRITIVQPEPPWGTAPPR